MVNKIKRAPNTRVGGVSGWLDKDGYWRVRVDRKIFLVHRIIFLMTQGYLPEFVDHKDGNSQNNQPENLREVSKKQNRWNCKGNTGSASGIKGVYRDGKKWKALCNVDGQRYYLGMYEHLSDAEKAVNELYKELHKEYAKQ